MLKESDYTFFELSRNLKKYSDELLSIFNKIVVKKDDVCFFDNKFFTFSFGFDGSRKIGYDNKRKPKEGILCCSVPCAPRR